MENYSHRRAPLASKPHLALPSAFLALMLLSPVVSGGQTSKVGAALEGTVNDQSGALIEGAQVRIRNTATGWVRFVSTDDRGFFRAGELPVGTYEVAVNQPRFAPYFHTGVTLTVGQTARLGIELLPATAVERITVSAQPPIISPLETTATTTVERERIEELPVRTRNALDFVLLAPGVAASGQQPASGGQQPLADSGFTFGGLRPRSNSLSIDGVDNNDEFSGGSRTELSPEIVREFQVVNNGLSAQFGGASGGSINVVTRAGTNATRGDAFVFLENGGLNAREPITQETAKPHLTRLRAGASRGGAVVKDRTFYYAAVEQEHIRSESASDVDPAAGSGINTFLARGAFPRLATRGITQRFFPISRSETEASTRFDHQLTDRNSLMLRYAFTNNKEASDAFNASGLTDVSARGSNFTQDSGLVGSLTSLRGSNTVNDLRFQLARRSATLRTNDQTGPEIDIVGLLSFGRPYAGNSRHREDHYEMTDTFARTKGRHLFKVGGTGNYVHIRSFAPDGFGGTYLFSTLAAFLAGVPDGFRQAFGSPHTVFGATSYGLFIQDHLPLTRELSLDAGARYDFEQLPPGINRDADNFSPRVGLAYSPSNRWVLRGGFGVFFDRYVLANLNRIVEKNGQQGFEQIADGAAAAAVFSQAAGGPLAQPAGTLRLSMFRADPNLATSYSEQASLGFQFLLSKNLTAAANCLFVRGVKLSRTRNTNLLPPAVLTPQNAASLGISDPTPQQLGRQVFGPSRLDSTFDSIYQIEDSATSAYNGFSLTLNRREKDFTLAASYTVSKTIDDASDFAEQPQNPFDLRTERALSLNDQAQRFVLSGLFDLPFGSEEEPGLATAASRRAHSSFLDRLLGHVELAPIITISSGRPIDPLTGLDTNRSHAFPLSSRPLGFERNSLRTPVTATVDLRVLKTFYISPKRRLDFVVESFNLLNRTNVSLINPFFGSGIHPVPGFAGPIDAFTARQVEFSLDLEYYYNRSFGNQGSEPRLPR